MNHAACLLALSSLVLSCAASAAADAGAAAPAASAASGPAADHARAGVRCEAAVTETVRGMRGREAQEVEFFGAKRAIAPTPEQELGVKGEGRYHGPGNAGVRFTYGCAFNPQTSGTSGVVIRDLDAAPRAAAPAWQPDLRNFTPDGCEAATATALKDKYPRVGSIAFDSGTRQLHAGTDLHTSFEGRGAMVRAPGMPSMPFSFRCEFETASGKVVGVQTHE